MLHFLEESEEEVSSDEELDLKEAAKLRSEKKKVRIYSSDESESEKAESEGASPKNMKQIIHSIQGRLAGISLLCSLHVDCIYCKSTIFSRYKIWRISYFLSDNRGFS